MPSILPHYPQFRSPVAHSVNFVDHTYSPVFKFQMRIKSVDFMTFSQATKNYFVTVVIWSSSGHQDHSHIIGSWITQIQQSFLSYSLSFLAYPHSLFDL